MSLGEITGKLQIQKSAVRVHLESLQAEKAVVIKKVKFVFLLHILLIICSYLQSTYVLFCWLSVGAHCRICRIPSSAPGAFTADQGSRGLRIPI
jgi:hypothetical protein